MNIPNQFQNFLSEHNFIMVDHNQVVSTLIQQIESNEHANIIIKGKNELSFFQEGNILDLLKEYDPKKKIRTFINVNIELLPQPIVVNLDKPDDTYSSLNDLIEKMSNETIVTPQTAELPGSFKVIDFDPPVGESGGNNSGGGGISRWTDFAIPPSDPPVASAKPYYIVSEFDEEVETGTVFNIDVFLSKERGNKSSPSLLLQEDWTIDILVIPKSGLDLAGDYVQSILVKEENLNKKLRFIMKARSVGKGSFVISARYCGTELFHIVYEISIVPVGQKTNTSIATNSNLVKQKPLTNFPDLTLLITQGNDNGKLILRYYLHSPDNSLNLVYKNFQTSIAQQNIGEYFLDFFNDIDAIKQNTRQERLNAVEIMKAKGAKLYKDLFSEEFRRILWSIHDKIKSIVINSDEPWIPWEMFFMYPEESGIADGIFLCEAYEISRWISGSSSPVNELSLSNAAIVIPSDSKLVFPPTEKNVIEATLNAINGHLTEVTASFHDVKKELASGEYTVWHFSGHGTDSSGTNSSRFKILLENSDTLSPDDITGLKSLGKGKPIIFFNACLAGKPGLGLTGLSGWPKQFIDNNASAFIGTYWSVIDETASKFSAKFYDRLAAGQTIAAAVKEARLHIKNEGNPTWLAYSLYADPFAKVSV